MFSPGRGRSALRLAVLLAAGLLAGCGRAPEHPNVLLILVDTLRADALGCDGAPDDPTPAIDALAASGTRFTECRAQSSWTLPTSATILTGRYPTEHGATGLATKIGPHVPRLAGIFHEHGYATGAIVSHGLVGSVHGFDVGFDHFDEQLAEARHDASTSEEVTERALAWLGGVQGPYFLFLHYFDPHFNYQFHEGFTRDTDYRGPLRPGMDISEIRSLVPRLGPRDHDYLRVLYDGEVRYLDAAIGTLVEGLKKSGRFRNTIVVLVGDHGEEFFEHGWIGHTRSHYEEVARVPLLLEGPGVPRAVREDTAMQIDLFPTILARAGIPAGDVPGRDLLSAPRTERAAFAETSYDPWTPENVALARAEGREPSPDDRILLRSVRSGEWKAIEDWGAGTWRLFDLPSDPGERMDLSRGRPDVLAALRDSIAAWQAGLAPAETASAGPTSDAYRERLRALGYVK